MCSSDREVEDSHQYRCLCCREPCDFLPALEALEHLLAIGLGGEEVTSRAEVLGNETIGGEEPLCVSRGLESLQAPLLLAGRLVGVLGVCSGYV
jgi:hypothetical protein